MRHRWPKVADSPEDFVSFCNATGLREKFIAAARRASYTDNTNWDSFLAAFKRGCKEGEVSEYIRDRYRNHYDGQGKKFYIFRRVVAIVTSRGEVRDFIAIGDARPPAVSLDEIVAGGRKEDLRWNIFLTAVTLESPTGNSRKYRAPDVQLR